MRYQIKRQMIIGELTSAIKSIEDDIKIFNNKCQDLIEDRNNLISMRREVMADYRRIDCEDFLKW